MMPDPDLVARILRLKSGFFPDCTAVLVYGSALTGKMHSSSDVDVQFVRPGYGDMEYRTLIHDGLQFECFVVPSDLIPYLPQISLRAMRPLGLFGFASGELIDGILPNLPELRPKMQAGIAQLNEAFESRTLSRLAALLTTVSLAQTIKDKAARIAMALRAVPALLETELQIEAKSYLPNRHTYREIATGRPEIVMRYASIAQAVGQDELEPLVAAARALAPLVAGRAPYPAPEKINPALYGAVLQHKL